MNFKNIIMQNICTYYGTFTSPQTLAFVQQMLNS